MIRLALLALWTAIWLKEVITAFLFPHEATNADVALLIMLSVTLLPFFYNLGRFIKQAFPPKPR